LSSYTPTPGSYQPPVRVQQVGAPFSTDLGTAYCMASAAFQQQLLELTGVFITCLDPSNCTSSGQDISTSWGYRENANNESYLQHTYIGLSAGLWPNGNLMTYDKYEYNVFDSLLMHAGLPVTINPVYSVVTNPPTNMTVLAALAHELGHIYWWKLSVDEIACVNGYFDDISWLHADKAPQYHKFGIQNPYSNSNGKGNAPKTNHKDKDAVLKDLQIGNHQEYNDLNNIYSGYWASLFGTVAPDEDFIEAYKLWVLTSAQTNQLANFWVTIPNYSPPVDMVALMNTVGTELNKKRNWISGCIKWS
jgi:hypothetical protein